MIKSPTRRVAVVNSAQTVLSSSWSDRQHIDLISEAATQALKGTGLRIDDVDFVIDSGSDFLDGRSISNCGFLGSMGAHHKEESRVEEDGLWALNYATNKIAGGSASVGLVIAYSKPSESNVDDYWTSLLEPFLQRPIGLDQYSAAGLIAQQYLAAAGLTADDLRAVSERAWANAVRNSNVDVDVVPTDEAFWNEDIATPLRRADMARPVDGAVAMLVCRAEIADEISSRPVWITGMGSAIDQHFLAARAPTSLPACEAAARAAYRMSGDTSPSDYDLVELSANSTVGELMVLEALGQAEAFHGIDHYRGDSPTLINPSGGALPADPIMATGLVRMHEAASRLAGRTGYESNDAHRALVHGTGGFGMQNHCVVTIEVDA
ncbi:3-ketoacyl-CoA thiolase [Cryobacterium sp. TMS1-20-1]|uniref:thiolase C-terminal domain-containing protein n=1 Tax=Cryobacterium sp. TMS1-20-1 TaxID=1259223 RepID=UPI00106BA017|nr:3-ketoacyl-CoA thiolase [Cryobacterium sp. TMS1-20-1]TFC70958.1 3-ketoacyl-CoA thiolase [Cryobacterium sp. TMS1-20-1]